MSQSIPPRYKPWIIVSLTILVLSMILLGVVVTAGFSYFGEKTLPLWVIVMGAVAALGTLLGFGGFFVLLLVASWLNWRESRRVQVIPPGEL